MSRRYWPYFLDTVRYPEIQHNGPLALLAEAEGDELDRLYDSALKVRDQFFPMMAQKEGVLLHGRSRGIPRHFLENDGQYRSRVLNAWSWQHLAGRHWGLYKIFAAYGFPVVKLENLKNAHWAEFDIEVEIPAGVGLDEKIFDLIFWIVFEYKRASAMLRTLRVLKRARGKIHVGLVVLQGERHTVYPPSPVFPVTKATVIVKAAVLTHEHWVINPKPAPIFKAFAKPDSIKLEFSTSEE